jgi:hypothetical protein
VIEPFAGFAAFSCVWWPAMVILFEINPLIFNILKYLQRTSADEFMRLPTDIVHVDELPSWVCEEARNLIGFSFNRGLAVPGLSPARWARENPGDARFWNETRKWRIASQLHRIRHWDINWGSYEEAPDVEGHWFIDPPYSNRAGRHYPYNDIDYAALADWCKRRPGYVQVCENDGATWLPFRPIKIVTTSHGRGYSVEAVCEIDNRRRKK